jgi:Trk K+ transport system NAD-binding subunit
VGIEKEDDTRFIGEIRGWKIPVVTADARQRESLLEAGLMRASAIVPCADDDLTNLDIALEARRLRPEIKVVLRLFDDRLAENVKHGFGIHTAFSTSALSAPAFAAAATHAPVDYAFSFGDATGQDKLLLTISKFTVVDDSPLIGYTLEQLEREFEVAVLLHRHGENVQLHPASDAVLQSGDGFVVSAEIDALNKLATLTPTTQELRRARMQRDLGTDAAVDTDPAAQ